MNRQHIALILRAVAAGLVMGILFTAVTYPPRVVIVNCPSDQEENDDFNGAKPSPSMLRYT